MVDQEKDKQLDALLDSLLSHYSDVEPCPGLETRIRAAVTHTGAQPAALWWKARWIWMGAAAAVLVALVIAMLLDSHAPRKQVTPVVNSNAPSQPSLAAPSERNTPEHREMARVPAGHHIAAMRQTAAATGTEARREVFPTPVPLSDQEKLALRYLSGTPRAELLAQSHPDPVPDEDLLQNQQGVFNPLTNNRSSANSN